MTIDESGVVKWVGRCNLYRDDLLYKFKACVKAWAILAIVVFPNPGARARRKRKARASPAPFVSSS